MTTTDRIERPGALRLGLAAAGPATVGLVLAARDIGAAAHIARLPLIWLGVTALMAPALYIGMALGGAAPRAPAVAAALGDGLARGGALLLGLAPALLFLGATAEADATARLLAVIALCVGAGAGLAAAFRGLFDAEAGFGSRLLFMGWAAVLLGIAGQL